jgi:hypothetical protein
MTGSYRFLLIVFAGFLATPLAFSQSYTYQQETLPCLNKKFTVVVHAFRDSMGNFNVSEPGVHAAIQGMNTYFEPIGVSFEACEFQYHDNFRYDSLQVPTKSGEMGVLFHQDYRINVYLVSFIPDYCGFAAGGLSGAANSNVFIRKDCVGSGVFAHEFGHLFGLLHTFTGSGAELVNGANCATEGDLVCDTPADPYVALAPLEDYLDGCRFISTLTDANGDYYNPDVGNIMSYYPCGNCGFSWGQLNRMAQNYLGGNVKLW